MFKIILRFIVGYIFFEVGNVIVEFNVEDWVIIIIDLRIIDVKF